MTFDPDKYLAEKTKKGSFDPDKYLANSTTTLTQKKEVKELPFPFKQIRSYVRGDDVSYAEQKAQEKAYLDKYKNASREEQKRMDIEKFKSDVPKTQAALLRIAQFLPATKILKGGGWAAQLGKNAFNEGVHQLLGRAAEEQIEGASPEDAIKKGVGAGATTAAFTAALPATWKLGTWTAKKGAKSFSKMKPWVLDALKKNPELLDKAPEDVYALATETAENSVPRLKTLVESQFNKKMGRLNAPSGKIVKTSTIPKTLKKQGIDSGVFLDQLKTAAKREATYFGKNKDKILSDFVQGKPISHSNAKKINSLLFDITKTQPTNEIGGGLISKIKPVKSALVKSWDKAVPGVRNANKYYSKKADLIKRASASFGNTKTSEGTLRSIGQEMSGVTKNKGNLTRLLKNVDRYQKPSSRVSDRLKDSVVLDEFSNRFKTGNFGDMFRMTLPSGIGASMGATTGPVGATLGAGLGAAAGAAMQSPAFIKKALKTVNAARAAGIPQQASRTVNTVSPVLGRVATRLIPKSNPDGSLTPSYYERIKQERGLR